jgi:hypothetical protein
MAEETISVAELEAALARFQTLLDRKDIDARQEHPPTTIYTPWVVVWLMVYQRLHANASLHDAVGELFRLKEHLPPNRRITEDTLSSNTGAYSQARTRLDSEVAEAVSECFSNADGRLPSPLARAARLHSGWHHHGSPFRRSAASRIPARDQPASAESLADSALGGGA